MKILLKLITSHQEEGSSVGPVEALLLPLDIGARESKEGQTAVDVSSIWGTSFLFIQVGIPRSRSLLK